MSRAPRVKETIEKRARFCPQCGRALEEEFVICPYCGRSLLQPQLPVERKKRSKLRWAAGIVLAIILVFATFSVLSYMIMPRVKLELVNKDATFTDDSVELTVTLRNTGLSDATVEVKFKTQWDQMTDTETKDIFIPAQQTRTVSAILNANPVQGGITDYEVTWFARAIASDYSKLKQDYPELTAQDLFELEQDWPELTVQDLSKLKVDWPELTVPDPSKLK